jgi:hypothetical protein
MIIIFFLVIPAKFRGKTSELVKRKGMWKECSNPKSGSLSVSCCGVKSLKLLRGVQHLEKSLRWY